MDHDSFFSVDNLVEFGISMAMAQQMVGMFNQSMQQAMAPAAVPASAPKETLYYIGMEGKPVGPLHETELIQLIRNRQVNKDTLVWMQGMPSRKAIQDVPAVLKLVALNTSMS